MLWKQSLRLIRQLRGFKQSLVQPLSAVTDLYGPRAEQGGVMSCLWSCISFAQRDLCPRPWQPTCHLMVKA